MIINDYQKSVFDGLVLSDAYLKKVKINNNSRFVMSTKMPGFAKKTMEILSCFNWSSYKEKDRYDKRTKKIYHQCLAESKVDSWITEQRVRWYPDGVKIVPRDFILNEISFLWWWIGDGHLYKKKSRPKYRRAILCTNSFDVDSLNYLKNQVQYVLGNDSIYIEDNKIVISKKCMVKFSNMMPIISPVEEYQYKFDFGQYLDGDYREKSYEDRPLKYINEFRKNHKVRELNFINKQNIRKIEV